MCWACEEQDLWFRYQLERAIVQGAIPEGFVAADFEAYGLPVPGSPEAVALLATHSVVGDTSGSSAQTAEQAAWDEAVSPAPKAPARMAARPAVRLANPFVCEPADRE